MDKVVEDYINMIKCESYGYIPTDKDMCKLNINNIKAFINI